MLPGNVRVDPRYRSTARLSWVGGSPRRNPCAIAIERAQCQRQHAQENAKRDFDMVYCDVTAKPPFHVQVCILRPSKTRAGRTAAQESSCCKKAAINVQLVRQ